MELDRENILKKFLRFSGELLEEAGEQRQELWRELCGECARWTEQMAGEGAQVRWEELESLAAARAFYQLVLIDEAAAPEALSTPDLKIDWGDRKEKARRLLEEKRELCAPLLRQTGFYFGQI